MYTSGKTNMGPGPGLGAVWPPSPSYPNYYPNYGPVGLGSFTDVLNAITVDARIVGQTVDDYIKTRYPNPQDLANYYGREALQYFQTSYPAGTSIIQNYWPWLLGAAAFLYLRKG